MKTLRIHSVDFTGLEAVESGAFLDAADPLELAGLVTLISEDQVTKYSEEVTTAFEGSAPASDDLYGGIEYCLELDFSTADDTIERRRWTGPKATCFGVDGEVDLEDASVAALVSWLLDNAVDESGAFYTGCVGGRRVAQNSPANELRAACRLASPGQPDSQWYPEDGADAEVEP